MKTKQFIVEPGTKENLDEQISVWLEHQDKRDKNKFIVVEDIKYGQSSAYSVLSNKVLTTYSALVLYTEEDFDDMHHPTDYSIEDDEDWIEG